MVAARRGLLLAWLAAMLAGCTVSPYQPCEVEVRGELPADAFARCRSVLAAHFPSMLVADAEGFRLQSDWAPFADGDRAAQRRATVFRHGKGLGVVVEARYLVQAWLASLPTWSEPRADRRLERELSDALAAALASAVPPGS